MAISNIYGDSGGLSLIDLMYEARANSSSLADSSSTMASSNALLASLQQSKKAQSAYGGGSASSAVGQAALNRALSEMQTDGGKVTFKDISAHREKLELEFIANVRSELAKQGVSIDTEFSLEMTSEGKIEVLCDDPVAKEKIQQYLEDNPKICEQFGYIQALSNLERARQSPAGSKAAWQEVNNAKAQLQTQALEAFFSDSLSSGMDYSSILANFGAGENANASFYTGLNFTV